MSLGIAVRADVREYPDLGQPTSGEALVVESHWNFDDRVVLCIGGQRHTYLAAHLIDAIRRASR